jgi:hypothetical protein
MSGLSICTLRRSLQERIAALKNLYSAVKKSEPYLRGSEYAHALQDLNKPLDRQEG